MTRSGFSEAPRVACSSDIGSSSSRIQMKSRGGCMFRTHTAACRFALRKAVLATVILAAASVGAQNAPAPYVVETVSTHADRVSGGDVLVKITYDPVGQIGPLVVKLNGNDATFLFRAGSEPNT